MEPMTLERDEERFELSLSEAGLKLVAPSSVSFAEFCRHAGDMALKLGFLGPSLAGMGKPPILPEVAGPSSGPAV